MRTIFIGDVHGCIDELIELVRLCSVGPSDRVVLVGDLVAKGPDSRAVVQWARENNALSVRGNHDDRVLKYRHAAAADERAPVHARVAMTLHRADWDYLTAMPLWRSFPEHNVLVVHGGVVPGRALQDHSPDDLMNLRSIDRAGRPSRRVDNGDPWAQRWRGPERIVFGHDARRGLQRERFATGLDTGCVYGGALTALILPENRLVSVKSKKVWAPRTDLGESSEAKKRED